MELLKDIGKRIIDYEASQAREIRKALYIIPIIVLWIVLSWIFIFQWLILGYWLFAFFILMTYIYVYEYRRISNRKKIHSLVLKEMERVQSIEDTLSFSEEIYSITKENNRQGKIWMHFSEKKYYENIVLFHIYILQNLRSDLALRLSEQQYVLESAKSEVSKNIQWTTELDHVSELQRVRLDKQIEQFEELQRVLIKV